QVDLLLDRLLLDQPQPDPEGPAVRQPQLATLFGRVAGPAEFILDVFEPVLAVVAFDGENFAEDFLQPLLFPLPRLPVVLTDFVVGLRLNPRQIGQLDLAGQAAKVTNFSGAYLTRCGNRHAEFSSDSSRDEKPLAPARHSRCR